MISSRLQREFKNLAKYRKLIGIGSLLVIAGCFLPWYEDVDAYGHGDLFLGVTGPLYLAGWIVLMLAVASFLMVFFELRKRPLPRLPIEEGLLNLLFAGVSFFLLVIANSVFLHTKFGVNIASKDIRVGMFMALVGVIFMGVGGYIEWKTKQAEGVKTVAEGKIEPLIDIEEERRHREVVVETPVGNPNAEEEKVEQKETQNLRMDL